MAAGIASGFVRKLYRILDQESETIVGWDANGLSFSIHDSQQLNDSVLPRYFRGRMSAFRQQLLDHGFEQMECEDNEARECYAHPHFLRGCPDRLSYIVRNPKPKLKPGKTASPSSQLPQSQPRQHQQVYQQNSAHQQQQQQRQPSLGVQITPGTRGPGRTPLTVTLMAGKRVSPVNTVEQIDTAQKRLRSASPSNAYAQGRVSPNVHQRPTGQVPAPPPPANLSRNPLFSNDASTDLGLDVARVFSLSRISDSGLLPNSTDLPEPISYLTRLLNGHSTSASAHAGAGASSSSLAASSGAQPAQNTIFSEDLMKSALYFLVSTSTTGIGPDQDDEGKRSGSSSEESNSWAARMERLSTSGFLSSLLVSSATGKDAQNGASSVWESPAANPLFSRSTEQDEDDDSIWNLLLASSIDRVKTAIQDVVSPQERLRLILEERERLEEQRKRIYGLDEDRNPKAEVEAAGPHKSTAAQSAKQLKSALKKPATNPLFSGTKKSATKNLLFTQPSTSPKTDAPKQPAATSSANPLFAKDGDIDQEKSLSGSENPPTATQSSGESSSNPNPNPLFATAPSATLTATNSAGLGRASLSANVNAAEDGLWRLLMTSSVDWLRKGAAEFEV